MPEIYEMVIPSDPDQIQSVEQKTEELAKKAGFNEDDCDSLAIAVTEIVANAINHGNKRNIKKKVRVRFEIENHVLTIKVLDQGVGFDPKKLKNPLDPENLYKESGRGIFIVKTLMDGVEFRFLKSGTEVTLTKAKTNASSP